MVVVTIGCKSGLYKKNKYQSNSYYEIKDRYIDNSLPDSIAIIEGNVFVIFVRPSNDIERAIRDTSYTCGGQVWDGEKYGTNYYEGKKYNLELPIRKTALLFHDFCTMSGVYLTDSINLHKRERIILDVMIYDERNIHVYNRQNPMLMHERKRK